MLAPSRRGRARLARFVGIFGVRMGDFSNASNQLLLGHLICSALLFAHFGKHFIERSVRPSCLLRNPRCDFDTSGDKGSTKNFISEDLGISSMDVRSFALRYLCWLCSLKAARVKERPIRSQQRLLLILFYTSR